MNVAHLVGRLHNAKTETILALTDAADEHRIDLFAGFEIEKRRDVAFRRRSGRLLRLLQVINRHLVRRYCALTSNGCGWSANGMP